MRTQTGLERTGSRKAGRAATHDNDSLQELNELAAERTCYCASSDCHKKTLNAAQTTTSTRDIYEASLGHAQWTETAKAQKLHKSIRQAPIGNQSRLRTSTRSVFHTMERSLRPTSFSDSTMSSTFLHPSSNVSCSEQTTQKLLNLCLQMRQGTRSQHAETENRQPPLCSEAPCSLCCTLATWKIPLQSRGTTCTGAAL